MTAEQPEQCRVDPAQSSIGLQMRLQQRHHRWNRERGQTANVHTNRSTIQPLAHRSQNDEYQQIPTQMIQRPVRQMAGDPTPQLEWMHSIELKQRWERIDECDDREERNQHSETRSACLLQQACLKTCGLKPARRSG